MSLKLNRLTRAPVARPNAQSHIEKSPKPTSPAATRPSAPTSVPRTNCSRSFMPPAKKCCRIPWIGPGSSEDRENSLKLALLIEICQAFFGRRSLRRLACRNYSAAHQQVGLGRIVEHRRLAWRGGGLGLLP